MSFQQDRITSIPAPEPTDYDRQYSFTDWETQNPGEPAPGAQLDAEFNAIQQALDETQARARLIQRDDGALANSSVGLDQLKEEALTGVNAPTDWTAFESYEQSDSVIYNNSAWYLALESHTASDDFAADLAAGKWRLLLNFTAFFTTEAEHWASYPEDQPVPEGDGTEYSALHHAIKAAASAVLAASAAADATAAQAALNLPALAGADAGKLIVVNGAGDGYDLNRTIAEAATASTVAARDANGRMKVADPDAADDVATKNYADMVAAAAQAAAQTFATNAADQAEANAVAAFLPSWTRAEQVGSGLSLFPSNLAGIAAMSPEYLAYAESYDENDELRMYQWDGAAWASAGSSLALPSLVDPALAALNDTDVALVDAVLGEIRTYRFDFNTNTWAQVGTGLAIAGSASVPVRVAALSATLVAVANQVDETLRTYEWDPIGLAWSVVGNSLPLAGEGEPAIAALNATDIAYTAETAAEIRTYRWDGADWSVVGNALDISALGGVAPALTAFNGTDIVLGYKRTSDPSRLAIYRWDGTDWAPKGVPFDLGSTGNISIAAISGNELAFTDPSNEELRTYRHNFTVGAPWSAAGGSW